MTKGNFWRGVKDVLMIWHGSWSDPELRHGDAVCNYWSVEDSLWEMFKDEKRPVDLDDCEDEFSAYCRENRGMVLELIHGQ